VEARFFLRLLFSGKKKLDSQQRAQKASFVNSHSLPCSLSLWQARHYRHCSKKRQGCWRGPQPRRKWQFEKRGLCYNVATRVSIASDAQDVSLL
jgi:hypothetical protein